MKFVKLPVVLSLCLVASTGLAQADRAGQPLRHGFSHFRLAIQPLRIRVAGERATVGDNPALRWVSRAELAGIGLPAPVRRLIEEEG